MGDCKTYGLLIATAMYCQTWGVMGPFHPLIAEEKHVPEWMVGADICHHSPGFSHHFPNCEYLAVLLRPQKHLMCCLSPGRKRYPRQREWLSLAQACGSMWKKRYPRQREWLSLAQACGSMWKASFASICWESAEWLRECLCL